MSRLRLRVEVARDRVTGRHLDPGRLQGRRKFEDDRPLFEDDLPDRLEGHPARLLVGSGTGTADSNAFVYGCRGDSNSSRVGASSTIRPRYITATRSAMWRTTLKLCVIRR